MPYTEHVCWSTCALQLAGGGRTGLVQAAWLVVNSGGRTGPEQAAEAVTSYAGIHGLSRRVDVEALRKFLESASASGASA